MKSFGNEHEEVITEICNEWEREYEKTGTARKEKYRKKNDTVKNRRKSISRKKDRAKKDWEKSITCAYGFMPGNSGRNSVDRYINSDIVWNSCDYFCCSANQPYFSDYIGTYGTCLHWNRNRKNICTSITWLIDCGDRMPGGCDRDLDCLAVHLGDHKSSALGNEEDR